MYYLPGQSAQTTVNLSNRNLSKEEEQVLSLGLNFAITPSALPKEKIIQEIEPALSRLLNKQEIKHEYR